MEVTIKVSESPIPPACVVEQLHKEAHAEEIARAEKARREEEERKKNIEKNVLKHSEIFSAITSRLIKDGFLSITIGGYEKNSWGVSENWWTWKNNFTFTGETCIVPQVYNEELFFTIKKFYEEAGYKVSIYEYSKSYYKDYELTINASSNCNSCKL